MKTGSTIELHKNLTFYLKKVSHYFGFLGKGEKGVEFVDKVRRSPAEKKYLEKLKNA